jgi:hypothetical protein
MESGNSRARQPRSRWIYARIAAVLPLSIGNRHAKMSSLNLRRARDRRINGFVLVMMVAGLPLTGAATAQGPATAAQAIPDKPDTGQAGSKAGAKPVAAVPANVENAVVKVFSTLRYPDPFKPWTKQAAAARPQ